MFVNGLNLKNGNDDNGDFFCRNSLIGTHLPEKGHTSLGHLEYSPNIPFFFVYITSSFEIRILPFSITKASNKIMVFISMILMKNIFSSFFSDCLIVVWWNDAAIYTFFFFPFFFGLKFYIIKYQNILCSSSAR